MMATSEAAPARDAELRAIVEAFPMQGFAIVDGGLFDDLPELFQRERLFARSLFLDTADTEVQAAGPWLVKLDQEPEATDKVFALVGDKPAAVFWCCGAGEMVLYRHLRGLNMARIPTWAARGQEEPPADHDGDTPDIYETVFFRHWDPRVLASLMPVLDADQFARMLGPADEFAFRAEDYGGPKRVVADPAWPPAPTGLLTIRTRQIEALTGRRLDASHRRIAAYLRDVFPEVAPNIASDELHSFVRAADAKGRSLGLESEAARKRWVYLVMASDGRVTRTPGALRFIQNGEASPDIQMKVMLERIAARLGGEAGPQGGKS